MIEQCNRRKQKSNGGTIDRKMHNRTIDRAVEHQQNERRREMKSYRDVK